MKDVQKNEIIFKICYTDLVYDRINKKLKMHLSKKEIEEFIMNIILDAEESNFVQKGKNIYITNTNHSIRLTVNINTIRLITADKLK